MIAIYVPTLGRPHALQRLVNNIDASTTLPHKVIFIVEPHDVASFDAARETRAEVLVNEGSPSYSNSMQTAYEKDDSPYFVAGNDDFDFFPNWDIEAMKVMGGRVMVVGIHDGSPQCGYSTISLTDRRYIEEMSGVIDIPNRVNYPYKHNYVDTEFHATAVRRGVFAASPGSVILHKHPDWGHAEDDETYRKSQSTLSLDATTFASRTHLWTT